MMKQSFLIFNLLCILMLRNTEQGWNTKKRNAKGNVKQGRSDCNYLSSSSRSFFSRYSRMRSFNSSFSFIFWFLLPHHAISEKAPPHSNEIQNKSNNNKPLEVEKIREDCPEKEATNSHPNTLNINVIRVTIQKTLFGLISFFSILIAKIFSSGSLILEINIINVIIWKVDCHPCNS